MLGKGIVGDAVQRKTEQTLQRTEQFFFKHRRQWTWEINISICMDDIMKMLMQRQSTGLIRIQGVLDDQFRKKRLHNHAIVCMLCYMCLLNDNNM